MGIKSTKIKNPVVLTVFGAGGDLTKRKIVPALYNLFLNNALPENFALLGFAHSKLDVEDFAKQLREALDKFSRSGKSTDEDWNRFKPFLHTIWGDVADAKVFEAVKAKLGEITKAWKSPAEQIFYYSMAPNFIETITENLAKSGLIEDKARSRIVIEKPFGHDFGSAKELNATLGKRLAESQIYRIDHYLGKETVQNILALRFANSFFEPLWGRQYLDHVQITVAEAEGVGNRGGYYEGSGALRDMVQNHLLQILCCVAMEPPLSFKADEVRNKKLDVLRAIRPIEPGKVDEFAVRGQYGAGTVDGKVVAPYRKEAKVSSESNTETFAAVKLMIDNWRWQGVPFYLRTGKRLASHTAEVVLELKPVPHRSFPESAMAHWGSNRLVIRIQPDEGITLQFQAKTPEQGMRLEPVKLEFSYKDSFKMEAPEAYETLLTDVFSGDATLFMRADQIEAAWAIVTPILEAWGKSPAKDFPNYTSGGWGPKRACELIEHDGRKWHNQE